MADDPKENLSRTHTPNQGYRADLPAGSQEQYRKVSEKRLEPGCYSYERCDFGRTTSGSEVQGPCLSGRGKAQGCCLCEERPLQVFRAYSAQP